MCLPQKNQKVKNVETSQLEFWWDILLLLAIKQLLGWDPIVFQPE